MRNLLFLSLIVSILMISGCASNTNQAPVNVMIMVQDDTADTIPYNHSSMKRLINKVSSDLSRNSINVYDWPQSNSYNGPRSEAMLVDVARSYSKATIDYLIVLSAEASVNRSDYSTQISGSVYGKTLALHSGRFKGAYTAKGRSINKDSDCNDYCVNSELGDSLQSAASELSAEILNSIHNANYTRNTNKDRQRSKQTPINNSPNVVDYTLVLEGFTQQDIANIEEYLPIFSGYQRMRFSANRHQYAEIAYDSSISRNKLDKNLNRMLSEMNVNGAVKISGNTVTVVKTVDQSSTKFDLDGWE